MHYCYLLLLSICYFGLGGGSICRPVFVFTGFLDVTLFSDQICNYIKDTNPDAFCMLIQPGGTIGSSRPMEQQVDEAIKILNPYFQQFPDGVDFISFSQGGSFADGVIKKADNHTVKTYLSFGGPQMGLYGIPSDFNLTSNPLLIPLRNIATQDAYKILYQEIVQNTVSVVGLWNDPKHQSQFLSKNLYLPKFLNLINHADYNRFKTNFLKLTKVVFLIGSLDDWIHPFSSGLGGYFNADLVEFPLENQTTFINDTYGLRTIYERGALIRQIIPGLDHRTMNFNASIQANVIPQLQC